MSSALLSLQSDFAFAVLDDKRIVKGFVSVQKTDRSGSQVSPESFDLENFANNKQLWLNHELINEYDGTKSAAGLVTLATPSYIKSENPNEPSEWVINRVETDEFVSFFPKSQVPDLTIGDKGLFVVAEVTHEKAIRKVDSGEVRSFSWQGKAIRTENPDGTHSLKDIDLIEMSLVNVGDNSQSNFVIVDENNPEYNKEISIKELVPYKMKLDKKDFSKEEFETYTKKYHPDKQISQTEDSYYIQLTETSDVVSDSAFNFTHNLIAAPMKKNTNNIVTKIKSDPKETIMSKGQEVASTEPRQSVSVKYAMINVDVLKMCLPSVKVTENVKNFEVLDGETAMDVAVDLVEIPQETVDAVIEAALEVKEPKVVEASTEVVDEVSEVVQETETAEPEVKEPSMIEQAMMALMQSNQSIIERLDRQDAEKAAAIEAVKNAEIEAKKVEAAKSANLFKSQMETLMNSAVPPQAPREEKVDTAKSVSLEMPQEDFADMALAIMFNKNVSAKGAL